MRYLTISTLSALGVLAAAACGPTNPTGQGGAGGAGGSSGTGPIGGSGGTGGVSPTGPDGCQNLAQNVSIREVAAYQSLKIPIAAGLFGIDPAGRVADVIQRRDTLFRVFVDIGGGFAARTMSARVTLNNGGSVQQFYAKKTVTGGSSDADSGSTFQVFVPADTVQANTRYSVEVVECGAGSGPVLSPRFPASGDAALGARNTGGLKVRIVPLAANGRSPDTSTAGLAPYMAYVRAMYPIDGLEFSVTSPVATAYPLNWSTMLDQVRAKRQADAPPADVYYFGLVKPTDTFAQYCGSGCTAGIGYVGSATQSATRAAVGIGWSDNTSGSTMAHELGHNHGRNHAPCGNVAGADAAFPYLGGAIGKWGYDPRSRSLLDPTRTTDIMGYCNAKWISDYTYKALANRVATVNAALDVYVDPAYVARWRVLLIEPSGPRWGVPFDRAAEPFGDPEEAEVLNAQGGVVDRVTVFRTTAGDSDSFTVLVPEPSAGWNSVHVAGAAPLAFSAPVTVPKP